MSIKIALAGNPNCGKTTLFNALTGSNQYVGNWPGVTVEKKEGKLKGHKDVTVVDLPGIYSLSPYTLEEVVSRNYLIDEKPQVILNIIDGTNLERNLYLTTQLTELGIPVLIAVNMMDIVRKNGDQINIKRLAEETGCKVVEISALKSEGIVEAANEAVKLAGTKKAAPKHSFDAKVERALEDIESIALQSVDESQKRWFAIKLFEINKAVEDELDDDTESIITNERYTFITSIIKDCIKKKSAGKLTTSDKIDKIVTNRILALPIFAAIMFVVYYIAVSSLGGIVTDWTNDTLVAEWIQPAVGGFLKNVGSRLA